MTDRIVRSSLLDELTLRQLSSGSRAALASSSQPTLEPTCFAALAWAHFLEALWYDPGAIGIIAGEGGPAAIWVLRAGRSFKAVHFRFAISSLITPRPMSGWLPIFFHQLHFDWAERGWGNSWGRLPTESWCGWARSSLEQPKRGLQRFCCEICSLAVDIGQKSAFGIAHQTPNFPEGRPQSLASVLLHAPFAELGEGYLQNICNLLFRVHAQRLWSMSVARMRNGH